MERWYSDRFEVKELGPSISEAMTWERAGETCSSGVVGNGPAAF